MLLKSPSQVDEMFRYLYPVSIVSVGLFQMHFKYLVLQKKIIIYSTHVVLLYLMNQVEDDVTTLPELCLIISVTRMLTERGW